MRRLSRVGLWIAGSALVAATLVTWNLVTGAPDAAPVEQVDGAGNNPDEEPLHKDKRVVTDEARADLLRRAHLWRAPETPVSRVRFADRNLDELTCRFKVDNIGGTTPKFDCELENGEEIRIKYGNGPEPPAETAATRLLRALGFGADDVTLVRKVRCYGCPMEPFSVMKAVEITRAEPVYERIVDYSRYQEFDWAARERKFSARPVETEQQEGWAFFELDTVDEARGGAPRAHVDGLRLMAVLLAHWDNKAENQRIVCLGRTWPDGAPCERPFLLLQDVGATFGPTKMNLASWEQAPVWQDRASCTLSMNSLPFEGATFGQATVTEQGRQFIGGLLSQLSEDQVTELFIDARFGEERGILAQTSPVSEWVRVFKQKVGAITAGPPCPQP